MVEIFKTTISDTVEAKRIIELLLRKFDNCKITIDMEDCDKIVRVEGEFVPEKVIELVSANNHECILLE